MPLELAVNVSEPECHVTLNLAVGVAQPKPQAELEMRACAGRSGWAWAVVLPSVMLVDLREAVIADVRQPSQLIT